MRSRSRRAGEHHLYHPHQDESGRQGHGGGRRPGSYASGTRARRFERSPGLSDIGGHQPFKADSTPDKSIG